MPGKSLIENKKRKQSERGPTTPKKKNGKSAQSPSSAMEVKSPENKKRKVTQPLASIPTGVPSSSSSSSTSKLSELQQGLQEKLKTAKFRMLNEKLYTTTGHQAKVLFDKEPELFHLYHEGYAQSMEKWPFQPNKNMIKFLNSKPANWVVADMGCGQAEISRSVKQTVHSFDLIAANDKVVACDMRHTPLSDEMVDCVIFSLSLMGTNFYDFLREASRICKTHGCLRVAELESRMTESEEDATEGTPKKKKVNPFAKFVAVVEHFGFKLEKQSTPNGYFVVFDFIKEKPWSKIKEVKDPVMKNFDVLKPCLYKKR